MTAVLLDTSVWRKYFTGRMGVRAARVVGDLLDGDAELLVHPAVLGELVLGGLSPREEALLGRLPAAPAVADAEVLGFVRQRKLTRRAVGWVDVHLLASALVAPAALWSLDADLSKLAAELEVAFADA